MPMPHCCCRVKDFVQAQALYSKCLQERPDRINILSNLATVHIELADDPQAVRYAQDAIKLDANHVKSLDRCGVAQMNLVVDAKHNAEPQAVAKALAEATARVAAHTAACANAGAAAQVLAQLQASSQIRHACSAHLCCHAY